MYPPEDRLLVLMPMLAMLCLAVWRDVQRNRIDNWITFPAVLIAACAHLYINGASGFLYALGGLAVGLALLMPFHVAGGMAAGDVKLMGAVGAFLGPMDSLVAAGASLVAGSLFGVITLATRGGLRTGLDHIGRQLVSASMTRIWVNAAPGSAAAHRFPYAIAIATGCLATLALQHFNALPGMGR